jgi:hypothetical protein
LLLAATVTVIVAAEAEPAARKIVVSNILETKDVMIMNEKC